MWNPKWHKYHTLQWKLGLYDILKVWLARHSAAGDIYGRPQSKIILSAMSFWLRKNFAFWPV